MGIMAIKANYIKVRVTKEQKEFFKRVAEMKGYREFGVTSGRN
ncbi:MAG: hypothetical protein E7I57_09945 [Anaerococcus vaginalis]|nr:MULTISPECIES: hypothetical protein [Bacillota]MDU4379726.1 hypothetical protein [Anaerococcus vaginalis]